MRVTIATTTGFHLRRLAVELANQNVDLSYFSYMPSFRLRRDGLAASWAHSLFVPLLPTSAFALTRRWPWQMRAVETMLTRTDTALLKRLKPSDVFIGLSAMAVDSAARARDLGATVIIERGSRHVLSQNRLVSQDGGAPLSAEYVARELASYEQADFIVVLSEHAAESFVDEGFPRERIFVCPLGVDLRNFTPTPRPSGPTRLLFVGGWSHRKGVDLLVKAVRQRPDWHLTHVGSLAGLPFPHGDAQFLSLGHLDHAELSRQMGEHHILVLPSREDGFGMVLLEALASGLPVVASRMTGGPDIRKMVETPEWVELVEPGNASDLLRGLDAMTKRESIAANEGSERQRLSSRDRARLSWESYAARYLAFLNRLRPDGGGTMP